MALRLTKTSLAPAEPATGQTPRELGEVTSALLCSRAGALLSTGDVDGYAALFADAAAIEHDVPRYRAQKLLIEQGLRSASDCGERRALEILLATARAAIGVIEKTPAEPRLLNYAGVAMYELWSLDAARALFQAAKRLDPEVPHLERNLQSVSERNRSHHSRKATLHPALRELSLRGKRAAALAQPDPSQRISLCMIMRDEEEMLPRTLAAIAPVVDEMIIVDTGSTDRSIEIARSYGATVIERPWTGDFSEARNASLDAASGDWILYLDADEVLVADDGERLRALAGHTWREAMFFNESNYTGTEGTGATVVHAALRLVRNRPEHRFHGRLHEQIASALPANLPERIEQSTVRIDHYGYLGVVRDAKQKSRRNLELLLQQKAEGAPSAFLHYNLGSEHFALGETELALAEFEEAWRVVFEEEGTIHHEFVPSLVARLVKALRAAGHEDEAIERAERGLAIFPGFTDLVYEQGMASLHLDRQDDAIAYLEKAISMGDAPSKYTALVGAGSFLPRIILAVRHLQRGEIQPAIALTQWCLDHHPEFFGALHPYATAVMKAGRPATEIVEEVESRVGRMTPTMRFMLGAALFEQGAAEVAEPQFRAVLAAQPHSGPGRAALVESLLYQRRYADAAAEAALLEEDSSQAIAVVRSELFARLLDGDLAGTQLALAKAARAGLADAEQAVYRAWAAQLEGREHPEPIPAKAGPLLALMLEALLRVQDFGAFEQVHALLGHLELPLRERRELLARIYLRRGFLRSAGREWMAVCEEQPDTSALVGLAQVALADGQHESAATFARETLALDPKHALAQAVLDACRQTTAEPVAA